MRTLSALATASLLAAGLTVGGAAQAQPVARPTIKVKASASEFQMNAGYAGLPRDSFNVTGTSRALASTTVKLQRRLAGSTKWVTTGKAKVNKFGSFSFKDAPSSTGMRSYRVIGDQGAVSRTFNLDVWEWALLVNRTGALENLTETYVSLNNKDYYGSLLQTTPGKAAYAEYTVGGVCRDLTALVGLNDSSLTGASGTLTISRDGTKLLDKALAIGAGERVTVDISSAQRVRFDVTSSADPKGIAAVGTPAVLCH